MGRSKAIKVDLMLASNPKDPETDPDDPTGIAAPTTVVDGTETPWFDDGDFKDVAKAVEDYLYEQVCWAMVAFFNPVVGVALRDVFCMSLKFLTFMTLCIQPTAPLTPLAPLWSDM
jgi:hypothetical protein